MQREAPTTLSQTQSPTDRTQMVYDAHSALEESLASVDALAGEVGSRQREIEGFDPQKLLQERLDDVRRQTVVCLRLFSPARSLKSSRGMDSVSALYGTASVPTERLELFLQYLRSRLNGVVPCSISVSAVRVAKRSSATVAARMAHNELTKALALAEVADDAGVTARAVRALDSADVVRKAVIDLGILRAECGASASQADVPPLAEMAPALSKCLSPTDVEALLACEAACRQQVPALRQLVDEQAAKRAALATTPTAPSSMSPPASPSTDDRANPAIAATTRSSPAVRATAATVTTTTARSDEPFAHSSTAPSSTNGALSRFFGRYNSGWKGHTIKAIGAILLMVLVRFLASRLYGAVKSAASLAHGAPVRRRTLTL